MADVAFSAPVIDGRVRQELIQLMEQNREQCLWFLRPGYEPSTIADMLRIIKYLQRYGTRDVYVKARNLAAKLESEPG
jgi:hypothetical protein